MHIAPETKDVRIGGEPARMLATNASWSDAARRTFEPVVRFMPGYDPYLLGYRSRGLIVDTAHARRVHPGGGLLRPVLLVDGRVIGTWNSSRLGDESEIVVESFAPLGEQASSGLHAEVGGLRRFRGAAVLLKVVDAG